MSDNKEEKSIEVLEAEATKAQEALSEAKKKAAMKEADKEDDDAGKDEVEVDVKKDKEEDEMAEAKAKKKKKLTDAYREEDQPEPITVKVKETVAAIFDGQTLSEEFKTKAETLVEGLIKLRVDERVEKIEAAAQKALEETVNEIEADLVTKVDEYHDYVANEFIAENQLAVESGLKMEIYKSFFEGLRKLFLEHNISVPDTEVNLLESTKKELEEAIAKINSLTEKLIQAEKTILENKKKEVVAELSEGLTSIQVEKLKALTCDIEAKDLDSFKEKAKILREGFFKEEDKVNTPKLEDTVPDIDKNVAKYLEGVKRYL